MPCCCKGTCADAWCLMRAKQNQSRGLTVSLNDVQYIAVAQRSSALPLACSKDLAADEVDGAPATPGGWCGHQAESCIWSSPGKCKRRGRTSKCWKDGLHGSTSRNKSIALSGRLVPMPAALCSPSHTCNNIPAMHKSSFYPGSGVCSRCALRSAALSFKLGKTTHVAAT